MHDRVKKEVDCAKRCIKYQLKLVKFINYKVA